MVLPGSVSCSYSVGLALLSPDNPREEKLLKAGSIEATCVQTRNGDPEMRIRSRSIGLDSRLVSVVSDVG